MPGLGSCAWGAWRGQWGLTAVNLARFFRLQALQAAIVLDAACMCPVASSARGALVRFHRLRLSNDSPTCGKRVFLRPTVDDLRQARSLKAPNVSASGCQLVRRGQQRSARRRAKERRAQSPSDRAALGGWRGGAWRVARAARATATALAASVQVSAHVSKSTVCFCVACPYSAD